MNSHGRKWPKASEKMVLLMPSYAFDYKTMSGGKQITGTVFIPTVPEPGECRLSPRMIRHIPVTFCRKQLMVGHFMSSYTMKWREC